ncbi:matrixin family metalloprotease [Tundrisphaera sp. TA3]|uniref:matrixin family metalloprotease n=1 Tax=Tundrisphaera sp. TA3 TaxID=3435775 RepID=UPI003EBF5A8B
MLSGAGVNYTLMGGQWENPERITFSFAPDGVHWDRGINNINERMNAQFGGSAWKDQIAKALQTWAASANLDFTLVGDGGYDFNASGNSQGDSRFGDIRIGGYAFPEATTLARTYGPPPNGTTGAGDAELNTSHSYAAGAQYDFGTIMLHEFGHSLGLGESPQPQAAMYMYYSGIKQSLTTYDIEGIQSLYGPRRPDFYTAAGLGGSASSSIDVSPGLNTDRQVKIDGLRLNAIGTTQYFSVVPPTPGSSLVVTALASGVSLLSPKVTVTDAAGNVLSANAQPSQYGNDIQVVIPGAIAGQRYTIAVQGATDDVFSVGTYALAVGFVGGQPLPPAPAPSNPSPVPGPPPAPSNPSPAPAPTNPTPIVAQIPADRFEPNDSTFAATNLGGLGQTVINGLTLDSAADADYFSFTATQAGTVSVASQGTRILVMNATGQIVAAGVGLIGFTAEGPGTRYSLIFVSPDGQAVASYGFSVSVTPASNPIAPIPLPEAPPAKPLTKAQKAAQARAARKAARLAAAQAAARRKAAQKAARLAARALVNQGLSRNR